MPLARVKTWVAGDILTASDLNTEFNNLINNGLFQPLNVNFDVGNFQLQNMRLENFAATQSSSASKIGRVYFQTAENLIHVDTGIVTGGTGANPGPGGIARVPAIQGLQAGDLIIASNYVSAQLTPLATSFERIGIGTANQILGVVSSLPAWTSKTPTVQVITSSGTYTAPAGLTAGLIWCTGGGGAGGGSSISTANGGGGGSGEITYRLATAATIGASQTVTIPAAAIAIPSNTNATGTVGGTVSFGAVLTAIGGSGGGSGNTGGTGGAGGTGGSNPSWAEPGFVGEDGADSTATVAKLNAGGGGSGGGSSIGVAGIANSGGGGGAGTNAAASGAGATGRVIVIEFYT